MSVGTRSGRRVAINVAGHRSERVVARCDCGSETEVSRYNFLKHRSCPACSYGRGRPEIKELIEELREDCPWLFADTAESVHLVAALVGVTGPLLPSEVGAMFGFSRQRAGQIEKKALEKFGDRARALGMAPLMADRIDYADLMEQWAPGEQWE